MAKHIPQFEFTGTADTFNLCGEILRQPTPAPAKAKDTTGELFPAHRPDIKPGDHVTLTGGSKWHDDISGVVADVKNNGDILEILRPGDNWPFRVTVANYGATIVNPAEIKRGRQIIAGEMELEA